jgi:hypothetical protein
MPLSNDFFLRTLLLVRFQRMHLPLSAQGLFLDSN